jgi:hypothetical protein
MAVSSILFFSGLELQPKAIKINKENTIFI